MDSMQELATNVEGNEFNVTRHRTAARGLRTLRPRATRFQVNAHARRGTVMILVMAILGVLFVTGITFLSTMNFEARMVRIEREALAGEVSVSDFRAFVATRLVDQFVAGAGKIAGADSLGASGVDEEGFAAFRPNLPVRAELPSVDGLIGALEPDSTTGFIYYGITDYKSMRDRLFGEVAATRGDIEMGQIDAGPIVEDRWHGMTVDADGDGIIDTRQFRLQPGDISSEQLSQLRLTLNDPDIVNGAVYAALRIVPHGAMANLNDSHPAIVRAALSVEDDTAFEALAINGTNLSDDRHGPYSPLVEERLLRRRFMLPPRMVPASAIQGDPNHRAEVPPGGGDFGYRLFSPSGNNLFPDGVETVRTGEHQYWPYEMDPNAQFSQSLMVQQRLNPYTADPEAGGPYDRRHLVTTVSHDDQLILEPRVEFQVAGLDGDGNTILERRADNVMDIVRAAARYDVQQSGDCTQPLRFEILNYPYAVSSEIHDESDALDYSGADAPLHELGTPKSWCEVALAALDNPDRRILQDERKGRLRLSLPFLDGAIDPVNNPGDVKSLDNPIDIAQRNRLIQEMFWLLLMNARSVQPAGNATSGDWGAYAPILDQFGSAVDIFFNQSLDVDESAPNSQQEVLHGDGFQNVSRTAAALTANMIDFMDADDAPTAIPVRWFGMTSSRWQQFTAADFDRPEFLQNATSQDIVDLQQFDVWISQFGRPLDVTGGQPAGPDGVPDEVVYGLERQPFITEVAAKTPDSDGDGAITGNEFDDASYAVELFNPYGGILPADNATNYYLRVGKNGADLLIDKPVPANDYLVLYVDGPDAFQMANVNNQNKIDVSTTGGLSFENGQTIYLLRDLPTDFNARIVLDQFEVQGDNLAIPVDAADAEPWSLQRPEVSRQTSATFVQGPWFAPLPVPDDFVVLGAENNAHTLGADNLLFTMTDDFPVEVVLANTPDNKFASAFPTTGSLLLLMRYANRSITGVAPNDRYAFTSHLRRDVAVGNNAFETSQQIDNARMPVFDVQRMHHVDPMVNPYQVPDPANANAILWNSYRPGEFAHLPWGQLVFEYFTALPLASDGPYRNKQALFVDEAAQPRVDLEGLRVHGRINLNAAPWSVLRGLPIVPMGQVPPAFRETFRAQLELSMGVAINDDSSATPVGDRLAQSIVAYREARAVDDLLDTSSTRETGDYGRHEDTINLNNPRVGRTWELDGQGALAMHAFRRGTGFLGVGELANVRHPYAAAAAFRVDAGQIPVEALAGNLNTVGQSSYLKAIALLATLGDWATVRSHVFTVYGTLRGAPVGEGLSDWEAMADMDSRAVRFQETLDRLPVFLGDAKPTQIGTPVVGRYVDAVTD